MPFLVVSLQKQKKWRFYFILKRLDVGRWTTLRFKCFMSCPSLCHVKLTVFGCITYILLATHLWVGTNTC